MYECLFRVWKGMYTETIRKKFAFELTLLQSYLIYMRELLFSVTRDDFTIQTFRAGGKGGQKQNKTDSGVRCIHNASGAVGEGRDERSQLQNKKNAFKRCIASPKFKV